MNKNNKNIIINSYSSYQDQLLNKKEKYKPTKIKTNNKENKSINQMISNQMMGSILKLENQYKAQTLKLITYLTTSMHKLKKYHQTANSSQIK